MSVTTTLRDALNAPFIDRKARKALRKARRRRKGAGE